LIDKQQSALPIVAYAYIKSIYGNYVMTG